MHNQRISTNESVVHWPAGVVAFVSGGILLWIFFTVAPEMIANFFYPNSYLPILFLLFLLAGGLTYFFTTHLRRAMIMGSWSILILWFVFQHIFNWQLLLYVTMPFVVIELSLTFLKKK